MRNLIFLLFWSVPFLSFSQLLPASLNNNAYPIEIATCIKKDSTIDLEKVRSITNLLTNPTITSFQGIVLPKRKKTVTEKVKALSEDLEFAAYRKKKVDQQLIESLYTLQWIYLSYLQKADNDAQAAITIKEKYAMFTNSIFGLRKLHIKIPKIASSQNSTDLSSPFFNAFPDTIRPENHFDFLAKKTSTNAKNTSIVLLDSCSKNGSIPKFNVHDLVKNDEWIIKWGDEIHTEIFASHMFAALGYNVDYSYYSKNLTLILTSNSEVKSAKELIKLLKSIYGIDISRYIQLEGIVSNEMVLNNGQLKPYLGNNFVIFSECLLEARPNQLKRIGSFLPLALDNETRTELKASLLAHQFIDNWDTREENTLLALKKNKTTVAEPIAIFSDLGTCMGVSVSWLNRDFKAGLVNQLTWEVVKKRNNKLIFKSRMNAQIDFYKQASYSDLRWLAVQLEKIDSSSLRSIVNAANWPPEIAELYFHKMAARRASILKAMDIIDSHPIQFDRKLNLFKNGVQIIRRGKLLKRTYLEDLPVSYTCKKGRMRNYGNK
mgnify:CR=1 FL=1